MAITYPITLPSPGIRETAFHQLSVVAESRSPFSLIAQKQVHAGQLWAVDVSLALMERPLGEEWVAALMSLRGKEGTFLLGDLAGKTPRGSAPGTPLVDGASQTGLVLSTKGWTAGQTNILRRGDWIQLGNPAASPAELARLYKVMAPVNSDGGGLADIDIWPRLRESPANSAPLIVTNTVGTFELAENRTSWSINEAIHYGIEFRAVENLVLS